MEIQRLHQEDAKLKNQIVQYRERIENTPAREQGLAILTRDYNNTRDSYASLLKKSQEAQQAENLERRQKGEQFKVIDPARVPEKPYRPDITKILLIGLFLGFFSGVVAAFFREQMDRSFRDGEDLRVALGFKVLANIPRIGPRVS
jgi:succinoglycan biosynthesis transport protein ExoP